MAGERTRKSRSWRYAALIVGPLALLALWRVRRPSHPPRAPDAPSAGRSATSPLLRLPQPQTQGSAGDAPPMVSQPLAASVQLNDPPWPNDARSLTLLWILHPVQDDPIARHIDLAVRAGPVQRLLPIDARFVVSFIVSSQGACLPERQGYPRDLVASLWLNGGGNVTYAVRRERDELLTVYRESSSDGLCSDARDQQAACPVTRELLASIAIPAGATLSERFAEVERVPGALPPFRERALTCAGR